MVAQSDVTEQSAKNKQDSTRKTPRMCHKTSAGTAWDFRGGGLNAEVSVDNTAAW